MSRPEDKRRRRPSLNAVIAFCALLVVLGGTALAAGGGGSAEVKADKRVAKKVLKKLAPTLAVKKAKKAGSAATADHARTANTAGNAAALGGQPASAFPQSSKIIHYGFSVRFGAQQEIAKVGPLTLTAKCVQDGTDEFGNTHRDFAVVLISTTQNGSVFDASGSKRGGPAVTDFLNTDTVETERVWTQFSVATGTPTYDADPNADGAAQAPDGTSIEQIQDVSGDAVNLPGVPGCLFHGALMVDSP